MGGLLIFSVPDQARLEFPATPGGLVTRTGRSIDRVTITCRLGPTSQDADSVQSRLEMHIRYLAGDGTVVANEWLTIPILIQRQNDGWGCEVGRSWSWSTDWPD